MPTRSSIHVHNRGARLDKLAHARGEHRQRESLGQVRMAQVAAAGGEILKTGEGDPLIFVSGLSGIGRYRQPQVPFYSSRFRVITHDQRGTGASNRLQRVFSIDQVAAELAALMDAMMRCASSVRRS